MISPIISIQQVTRRFGQTPAVNDFSLDIMQGELVALLGPSGCGKTTLLRIIAGFDEPTSGSVRIEGHEMVGIPPHRRPVNMVFQKYALFPHLDVYENVAFGLGLSKRPAQEIHKRVSQTLDLVRLAGFEKRRTAQLSGGEAQRVALARALVMEPKALLLDEPLGALDLKVRQQLETELRRIHSELGTTFIYVTHDQSEAMTVSNRLVIMDHGRLIQEGTPQEVYYNPNCIFCASFVGESNLLPARVVGVGQEATLVRVGERTVRARPNPQAREGQAVSLLIRPEVLSLDRQAPNHDNILQGEIIDVTFLGSSIVFRVDTGWDKPLQVQQAGKDDPDLPKRGEKVALGWSSYDTLVLLE